jgi:hypothetical protein
MSARNIVYKDWVMSYVKKKNKTNYFWYCQKIDQKYWNSQNPRKKFSLNRKI